MTNMVTGQKVDWIQEESKRAEEVFELDDKNYLIYYSLDGCWACEKMSKILDMYSAYINSNFYSINVNCSKEDECEEISVFPKLEIVAKDGGNKIVLEGAYNDLYLFSTLTQIQN